MEWRAWLDIEERKELNLLPYVQPKISKTRNIEHFSPSIVRKVFSSSILAKFPLSFQVFLKYVSLPLHVGKRYCKIDNYQKNVCLQTKFHTFLDLLV